ncbi:MAG: hypothetical protein FJW34_02285 [Acidobacteria bacterium]|nr:hypothetical protein [Acidobacteriota bacterium]
MTRQRQAQLITLAVLAAALAVVVAQRGGWSMRGLFSRAPNSEPGPQDAVYAMLDAAREGNVRKYLAAHTGQMEVTLRQAIAEKGETAFAAYLKEFNAPIKGIAILEPQPLTDREVRLRVEYVYQDRNEAQTMYLEKVSGGWKIARLDTAERVKTLIPYGTPVQ